MLVYLLVGCTILSFFIHPVVWWMMVSISYGLAGVGMLLSRRGNGKISRRSDSHLDDTLHIFIACIFFAISFLGGMAFAHSLVMELM